LSDFKPRSAEQDNEDGEDSDDFSSHLNFLFLLVAFSVCASSLFKSYFSKSNSLAPAETSKRQSCGWVFAISTRSRGFF